MTDLTSVDGHQRVAALLDWIEGALSCNALFVTDANGLSVEVRRARAEHVVVSAPLMRALGQVREATGVLASRMAVATAEHEMLYLVDVECAFGRFGVGILSQQLLEDACLIKIQAALSSTLGGGDEH